MRRNLSGIFISDKLPHDEKELPTCFEDCQEITQDEWMDSLNRESLVRLCKRLGNTIKEIGDELDLIRE